MDARKVAAVDRQVPGLCCTHSQHHGVVLLTEVSTGDIHSDVDAWPESSALGLHLRQPKIEVSLLHLELRDSVAQEAANAVSALVDHDGVTGPGELLCSRKPCGARPDNSHGFVRQARGWL